MNIFLTHGHIKMIVSAVFSEIRIRF